LPSFIAYFYADCLGTTHTMIENFNANNLPAFYKPFRDFNIFSAWRGVVG